MIDWKTNVTTLALAAVIFGCGGSNDSGADGGQKIDAAIDAPSGADASDTADAASAVDAPNAQPDSGNTTAACTTPVPDLGKESIGNFRRPVHVAWSPGSDDLYVVESRGTVILVRDGTPLEQPFLDITDRIGPEPSESDERGLLSIAFHPTDASRFFVGYSPLSAGKNVIAEGVRDPSNPDVGHLLDDDGNGFFSDNDPQSNHNGGLVIFGNDGFLYAGIGDGGGACDDHSDGHHGQNLEVPFGKILRFDVSEAGSPTAPPSNPFIGTENAVETIWAYGLRNPWRFSFDRTTGDLWIGDVGQDLLEEVDVSVGNQAGQNYGWSAFEANMAECLTESGDACCTDALRSGATHHTPLLQYTHADSGRSVVGGYVYRGSMIPDLQGVYLFADSYSGFVRGLRYCDGAITTEQTLVEGLSSSSSGVGLVSFAQDNDGELYLVYLTGEVAKVVAAH